MFHFLSQFLNLFFVSHCFGHGSGFPRLIISPLYRRKEPESRRSTDLLFPFFSDSQRRTDHLHCLLLIDREPLGEPAELLLGKFQQILWGLAPLIPAIFQSLIQQHESSFILQQDLNPVFFFCHRIEKGQSDGDPEGNRLPPEQPDRRWISACPCIHRSGRYVQQ